MFKLELYYTGFLNVTEYLICSAQLSFLHFPLSHHVMCFVSNMSFGLLSRAQGSKFGLFACIIQKSVKWLMHYLPHNNTLNGKTHSCCSYRFACK